MAGISVCLVLAVTWTSVFGGPTYFFTSPKTITRGSVYNISVDILNGTNVGVNAILQQRIYNGKANRYDLVPLKNVTGVFSTGMRGNLGIAIEDDFSCVSCQLLVQGRGSQVFERTSYISVKSSLVSIFIQTDKAIYKPGQRVRYRVFAVYPNLQIHSGQFQIKIRDPSNNKIVVRKENSGKSGVVEGFINLSDQPPFGDWTIQISLEDVSDTETQTFTVAEYELPRFEVTVDLPPFAMLTEVKLSGTVRAKYTFGKPVKGMVELHVGPDRGPDHCGRMPKTVNVAFEIDGEAKFSIPRSSIERVTGIYNNARVRVTAIVKEDATGVRLNGTNAIQWHSEKYTITVMTNTPNVFKPGLQYTAYVQVKSQDGLPPLEETTNKISVYPYATYEVTVPDQGKYGTTRFTGTYPLPKFDEEIPDNGIILINFDIPNNATHISFQAYFNSLYVKKDVQKTYSPSNNYMQLSLDDSDINSGDVASFKIKATEAMEKVYYEVISRGSITKTGTLNGNGESSISFDLDVTSAMGPISNLLTYYIRKNSEIVADSIAFNVDGIFENKVTIDFNKKEAEPDQEVNLQISADPKSTIFLLAVDQSVLLLKSGNDIDKNKVQNGISDQKPLDSEFALSHSAANVGDVFSKSGLNYITDAVMARPVSPTVFDHREYQREYLGGRNSYMYKGNGFEVEEAGEQLQMSQSSFEPTQVKQVKRIRKFFPEAWLWLESDIGDDGNVVLSTRVPDTITTWIASAFATNSITGLGVAATKANITVARSFFVSLTYPSTMKRNEHAVIQATVFNYQAMDIPVLVTMESSSGYQSIEISPDGTERIVQSSQRQRIQVRPNTQGVVYFPIVANEIGVFDIVIKAQSVLASDGVSRQINIEPEGAPASYNIPIFIEQSGNDYKERHSFTLPESTIAGSEKISVGVSGDLLGPSLDNIDSLLSIPMGCGEQNMVKFAPNLYIGQYLQATGQLSKSLKDDIVDNLFLGYQRQLSYRRSDGSFSAFGNNDQSGSTWLTAYVSRTFGEARSLLYVDPQIIISAIDWLVERQRRDGAFVELGKVIDPNTQGRGTGPALTAYCLLTLLENKELDGEKKCSGSGRNCQRSYSWGNATDKAINNLENSLNTINDPFPLSVVTYALVKARSSMASTAFRKLRNMGKSQEGLLFWNDTAKSTSSPAPIYTIWRPPHIQSRPIHILTSSYALLSYTAYGRFRQALPIIRWLTKQRNSLGGFSSTQDTTVALQALSAYATRATRPNTMLSMTFAVTTGESLEVNIDNNNLLNYQRREFKDEATFNDQHTYDIDVSTVGTGIALAEIDFSFNVKSVPTSQSFDISTVLLDDELDTFNLMVCTKWLKDGNSGMVVQEIEIPSGFEPDLTTIGNVAGMKRYERKGNVAAIYFDEIARTSTCYSLLMTRKAKVAKNEKSYIHTFSYYNPEDKATVFYQPRKLANAKICDVCDRCCRR